MKLDRSRPFGRISGDIFTPEGCDRPAFYEQDGKFFDNHDRLIVAGETVSIVPTEDDDDDGGSDLPMTVAELLRQADTMHWRVFRKHARAVLGNDCPATKATIIDALQAAQQQFDARAAKKRTRTPGVQPEAAAKDTGVDLAGWAMGRKQYLFGEIRKAIRTSYGKDVQERDDAVEFLVEQGVIHAEHARTDVVREP